MDAITHFGYLVGFDGVGKGTIEVNLSHKPWVWKSRRNEVKSLQKSRYKTYTMVYPGSSPRLESKDLLLLYCIVYVTCFLQESDNAQVVLDGPLVSYYIGAWSGYNDNCINSY